MNNPEEKIRCSGIVCEYNPFHNGHRAMLETMRRRGTTHIAAVMSGSFTQRGEPAIFDKKTRAQAALSCGVDLVIEIPLTFALAGAERFARGGVCLLGSLGTVDEIAFGSESGDTELLRETVRAVMSREADELIRKNLREGVTFAAARERAVLELMPEGKAPALSKPNDILGVEYIKAIDYFSSDMVPVAIKRENVFHDSGTIHNNIASAGKIRELILSGSEDWRELVPEEVRKLYISAVGGIPQEGYEKALDRAVMIRLLSMSPGEISELYEVGEGLENRIYSAVRKEKNLNDVIMAVKTKRYTYARIKRIMMYALLGIRKKELPERPLYLKVLAFNDRGRELLRMAKERSTLPVVTRYSDVRKLSYEAREMFDREAAYDRIYRILKNG